MPTVQSIQPKPTKAEILEAMIARAKVKHDAENERRQKLRESLGNKITALAVKATKSRKPSVLIYTYQNAENNHCDVQFRRVKTPELVPLLEEYNNASSLHWDEAQTRKSIRQALTGRTSGSPSRLLENPEAVKAIDALLEQWGR